MVYLNVQNYNLLIDGMGMPIMYTNIKGESILIMKRALLFFGMLLSMLMVCAEDNVLQTIEIVPVKDTYNIVLTADKAVDVKKSVQGANKVTLELKNIRASRTLNTVYNNVSNVDTVMVEPQGNGISIFFQAENAQAASVSFDSIAPILPAKSNNTQSVKLSNPIESYAPIYKDEISQEKTSGLFDKLTNKTSNVKSGIKSSLDETNTSDTLNKVFSYGLIGLLIFSVIRLFKRKDTDMKIGLSQSLTDREIELYKGSQHYANTYAGAEKPFTTVNYGINAYQRENRNPYETEPMTIHNPRLRNMAAQRNMNIGGLEPQVQPVQLQQTMVQAQPKPALRTVSKPHTTPVNTAPVNQSNPNVDNLKFLESMTAIYEKSGRHDLAQGLKASLTKNSIKA